MGTRFRPPKHRLTGRVFDGDRDELDARVTDSTVHQPSLDYFGDGVPWREARFYQEAPAVDPRVRGPFGCDDPYRATRGSRGSPFSPVPR